MESIGADATVDPWADYIWENTGFAGGFPTSIPRSLASALASPSASGAADDIMSRGAVASMEAGDLGAPPPGVVSGTLGDELATRTGGGGDYAADYGATSASGAQSWSSGGGTGSEDARPEPPTLPDGVVPPDASLLHLSNGQPLPDGVQYEGFIWTDMGPLAFYFDPTTRGTAYALLLSYPEHQSFVAGVWGSTGGASAPSTAPSVPGAIPDPLGQLRAFAIPFGGDGVGTNLPSTAGRAPVPLELQQALDEFAATPPAEDDSPPPTMEEALAYGRFLDELGKYRAAQPPSPPPDEPSPFAPGGPLADGDGAGGGINRGSPGVGGAPGTGGDAGNDRFGNEDLSGASGTSGSGHAPRGLSSAEQEQLGDALLLIVALAALGVGAPGALARQLGPAARPFITALQPFLRAVDPFLKVAGGAKALYSLSQVKNEDDPNAPGAIIGGAIGMSMLPGGGSGLKAAEEAETEIKGSADAASGQAEQYGKGPAGSGESAAEVGDEAAEEAGSGLGLRRPAPRHTLTRVKQGQLGG